MDKKTYEILLDCDLAREYVWVTCRHIKPKENEDGDVYLVNADGITVEFEAKVIGIFALPSEEPIYRRGEEKN